MEFAWNTQKNKLTDIKGLQMEQDREGKINNKEIDINKTHLNYDLADKEMNSRTNLYHRVKKRIEDVREVSRVQKNSVVDYSNIITVSKEQSEKWGIDKTKDYFKEAYNYFCDEFGKENVVSAKVHLDETAPHMHLHFVPVNLENGKLQSSKVVNPIRVNQIHTNAPKYLRSKGFEVERGIGKTKENLDIHEFKEKKLNERIKELEKEIDLKNNKINSLTKVESEIDNIEKIKVNKIPMSSKFVISESEFKNLKHNLIYLKSENEKIKLTNKEFKETITKIGNANKTLNKNLNMSTRETIKLKNENEIDKYNLKLNEEKLDLFLRAVSSNQKIEDFIFNKMQNESNNDLNKDFNKFLIENKIDPKFVNKILNFQIEIDLNSLKDKNIFDKNIFTVQEIENYLMENHLINFFEKENSLEKENVNVKFVADKNNNIFNLKLDCENKSFIKQILADKNAIKILKNEIKNDENKFNLEQNNHKNNPKKATFGMEL